MILLLDESTSDPAVQTELIPTTAEVKENVSMAISRAAKNGNLLFLTQKLFIGYYWWNDDNVTKVNNVYCDKLMQQ